MMTTTTTPPTMPPTMIPVLDDDDSSATKRHCQVSNRPISITPGTYLIQTLHNNLRNQYAML